MSEQDKPTELDFFMAELRSMTVVAEHRFEHLKKLKAQNKIMRDALEFYADADNWDVSIGSCDITSIKNDEYRYYYLDTASDFVDIGGKRARQALKEVGEV